MRVIVMKSFFLSAGCMGALLDSCERRDPRFVGPCRLLGYCNRLKNDEIGLKN
ncbi:hypothetical protein M408DRAFT_230331 [Serendipita vermifera MAFF 305830]|uniref:Uncharacterized protein n=1 Tax=Serendipita vermifera MAFF 305830 TaxID=933852 RepID=A0A0C2X5Y2_SERVB|nr:hypothetical protein M408DRAFT_230331 [Serendipita vermifera MAFF 305830]